MNQGYVAEDFLVLVKFEDGWADELTVRGFAVMWHSMWKEFVALAKKVEEFASFHDVAFSFGSNQSIEWGDYQEFIKCFTLKVIDDGEAYTLYRMFGRRHEGRDDSFDDMTYGNFPTISIFEDIEFDEDD